MTMHPKSECVVFLNICPKRVVLYIYIYIPSILTILMSSLVFIFFSQKQLLIKKSLKECFSAMGPCLFLSKHFFCLSHRKNHWTMLVDNVGLIIHLLGTLNSVVTLTIFFLLGLNRSGPKTSSTANHEFYMALGQLHGP